MSELWAEVWTRPGHANFGRVIDDPPSTGDFHVGLNQLGEGRLSLPDRFDRLDEILLIDPNTPLNCVSSLVRVYSEADPANPICEWLPDQLIPQTSKTDPTVDIAGRGIGGLLGYARLEAFDWNGANDYASRDPDWQYGGNDQARNGGLEEAPWGITNPGFEDGTREPWWPGAVEGYSANMDIVTTPVSTGTYAARVDPLLAESGASTIFRVVPGKQYTVTARVRGVSGVGYQLGCTGPNTIVPQAPATLATAFQGWYQPTLRHCCEAQQAFTGTGAYQTVTLIFTAAADQTRTQISIREGSVFNGGFFYLDLITVTGYGIGTDPWEPTDFEEVTVFQASQAQAFSGAWSLQTTAAPGHGVLQRFTGINPGVTYTASIAIGHASAASQWALEVRNVTGNLLGQATANIATNAWTELTVTFTIPDFLPGSTGEILILAINYATVARGAFVDDLVFYRGNPPTTVGAILGDIYQDAVSNHAPGRVVWEDEANPGTPYLTLDFTDSLDSNGQAWVDPEISVRLTMRMPYSLIMNEFVRGWGYEWRIVPDDPELGTWLWQVYNPNTMGSDFTAAARPALQGGATDVRRSVQAFLPDGTDLMVEGLERITSRARDGDLVAALGRIESSRLDRELPDMSATIDAADQDADNTLINGVSWTYTMVDPQDEPLIDYNLGDALTVHDPPLVDATGRCIDIVVVMNPTAVEYAVTFTPPVVSIGS